MFTGIMNADRLISVLEAGLLPFIEEVFPDGHRCIKTMTLSIQVGKLKNFLKIMA